VYELPDRFLTVWFLYFFWIISTILGGNRGKMWKV